MEQSGHTMIVDAVQKGSSTPGAAGAHSLHRQLQRQLRTLEAHTDYPVVVARLTAEAQDDSNGAGQLQAEVPYIMRARALVNASAFSSPGDEAGQAAGRAMLDTLDSLTATWRSEGLLQETAVPSYTPWQRAAVIGRLLVDRSVSATALQAADIAAAYGPSAHHDLQDIFRRARTAASLVHLASYNPFQHTARELPYDGPQRNPNTALLAALADAIHEQLGQIPPEYRTLDAEAGATLQFMDTARHLDGHETAAAIEISGPLPFNVDETVFRQFIAGNVPPVGARTVTRIEFRDFTEMERAGDGSMPRHARIVWQEDGQRTIIISPQAIRRAAGAGAAEEKLQRRLWDCTVHEFGHALHMALPPALLKQWLDAVGSTGVNITPYMRYIRDHKPLHLYGDDFAESISLLTNEPERLYFVSEQRLNSMDKLLRLVMPDYASTMRPRIIHKALETDKQYVARGVSWQQRRDAYLAHEREQPPIPPTAA